MRSLGVLAGGLLLIGAAVASAQDWPQWRGVNRDGKATGFSAPAKWPASLSPKWSVKVGTGCATPALVGDRLYVFARQGDEEVTLCLSAADGKEIWKDKVAAQAVTGPAARHPGPRSSPAVADGKVVTLGVGGVLSCLDAADGKVLWRKDEFPKVVPKFFTSSSPLVMDGMAVAHLGGPGNGALVALDLATGNPKWKWAVEGPDYGSPVLMTVDGTKQIVTPTEKSIVGIGASDGKLLWQVPFVPQGRAYNSATPVVDGSTVIVTGSARGTRALKVAKQGDGFAATPLWSNADVAAQFCTPVLKDGLLFGLSDRGSLFCLNAQTGQAAWTDSVQRDRGSFTALVDAGPVLLALPSSSELVVFKPDAKDYAEVARIKVAETPTYATPVVAGNRIFVKDQESVALLTLE
jgi:outer membrane protein assembly factor BamB